MPVGPTLGSNLLQMIFQAKGISYLCDNTATTPSTALWAALHTAAPTSDNQTSNEAAYGGYARTSINRTTAAWSVTAGTSAGAVSYVNPLATISFPQASSGSETETYFSIGLSSASTGQILVSGTLSPALAVSANVIPQLSTGSTITVV